MEFFGIYTLANDVVYDQLVGLLNSIEVNISPDIPVCIIPYDERLDRVKREVTLRKNVTLYDNWDSVQRWEDFAHQVWAVHSGAKKSKIFRNWWSTGHLQRKMCVFDGDFDKFVFCDADSLVMKSFADVFDKLNDYDFVFDDWIHTKPRHKVPLNIPLLEEYNLFNEKDLRPRLHCSDFFASKQGLFNHKNLDFFHNQLVENREVEWLTTWWDDAHLFNYLTFKSNLPLFNFTLSPNGQERTGNCANADAFVNINNVLYNQDGLKPIHRIHYMEYPAVNFARLCSGEDVNICYKDVFLHYRFLKQPEQKPSEMKHASYLTNMSRIVQKAAKKIQRTIS
ncbi:MAG: methionine synthase [Rhizonema sp. PD38]|nr:methionine synthase [Rhizonema sp. PD38]